MTTQQVAMVILGGPIKHWWDENWDTPAHWHYDAWREALNAGLVADGSFLVFRPHHAFKGSWTERGQVVNDAAIKACDVFIDMTPPGIPSEGTDSEKLQATSNGSMPLSAPPPATPEEFDEAIRRLIEEIQHLRVHRTMVEQQSVLECIAWMPGREWMLQALAQRYNGNIHRLHYVSDTGRLAVEDIDPPILLTDEAELMITRRSDRTTTLIPLEYVLKAEVLDEVLPVME